MGAVFFAGDVLSAADLNAAVNTEVGSADITTDSSSTSGTTESGALATVTTSVALVSGQTYWVELWCNVSGDAAASSAALPVTLRIREDSASGTQVQAAQPAVITNSSSVGFTLFVRGKYTAVANSAKTFVVTLQRNGGSGGSYQIRAGTGRNGNFRVVRRMVP